MSHRDTGRGSWGHTKNTEYLILSLYLCITIIYIYISVYPELPKKWAYILDGPHNKEYSTSRSTLGSLGKLPCLYISETTISLHSRIGYVRLTCGQQCMFGLGYVPAYV